MVKKIWSVLTTAWNREREEARKHPFPFIVVPLIFVGLMILYGIFSALSGPEVPGQGIPEQDKATTARAKVLQQKLSEIGTRPSVTIDDYIKNTFDAAPIIDEAKTLIPLQMAAVDRFKQAHPGDAKVAMTADYALRMFQKDAELMSLLGNEIYCARALQALPSAKQVAYYNENVLPLKEKEQQAGREWAALANEAAAKGVGWSDYVNKGAKALE
jgi:hypothetical protein